MPVAPAKAIAAVLGIARSTRMPGGKLASIAPSGTPAAIEMTSVFESMIVDTCSSTWKMTCGFTASSKTFAQAKSSELSPWVSMP